jgi:hypothetical protein
LCAWKCDGNLFQSGETVVEPLQKDVDEDNVKLEMDEPSEEEEDEASERWRHETGMILE